MRVGEIIVNNEGAHAPGVKCGDIEVSVAAVRAQREEHCGVGFGEAAAVDEQMCHRVAAAAQCYMQTELFGRRQLSRRCFFCSSCWELRFL